MIHIHKGTEPSELTDAKRRGLKDYEGLKAEPEVRMAIKQHLLSEQGYICAYCMQRISIDNMGIEHYIPQHPEDQEYDPAATIDYSNMLAVCRGNEQNAGCKENLTCDKHRGNTPLTVNPCSPPTLAQIHYLNDATIYSDDPVVDYDLNTVLNLNCTAARLPANRQSALNALKQKIAADLKNKPMSQAVCQKYLDHYHSRNTSGELVPYVGILIHYLEKKMRQIH